MFSGSRLQFLCFTDVELSTCSTDENVDDILTVAVEKTGIIPREFALFFKFEERATFNVPFVMVDASFASK